MQNFDEEIKYLKGVGPKRAELLGNDLKIFTIEDILTHFPYRYVDKTKLYKVNQVEPGGAAVKLKGRVSNIRIEGTPRKKRLKADFSDETGSIELIWFSGVKGIQRLLSEEANCYIFGNAKQYGRSLNMAHPELIKPEDEEGQLSSDIEGMYTVSEKMKRSYFTSKTFRKVVAFAIKKVLKEIPETLPPYIRERLRLPGRRDAFQNIHFPNDAEWLKKARYRLVFEELFFLQLDILRKRKNRQLKFKGYTFDKVGNYFNSFFSKGLPFELTGAQKRVIKEIRQDMGSGKQTSRLLQGDVGSGKTLVALMSALIALDNGFQTALLAPTEVLAYQHYKTIKNLLKGFDVTTALLTGSVKQKDRRPMHEDLKSGKLQIIIGTHALLEDTVVFNNLGLVIIDEQHRFGVAQRAKMWKKNTRPPHVIVMTATPIPRTLAMTVYGDLDVSIIDELPPGRKQIKTYHAYDSQRLRVFQFLRKQIKAGRQVYIVYPLIQESDKWDYKDLEDGLESISRAFPAPEYATSVVHGRMKPEEKQKSMDLFKRGVTQIMIATTVIEVGVDVPNASVMLIESAERFGLSQLHQLRGRVGRGSDQAYCLLMSSYKLSETSRKRLKIMTSTNDGFKIAEEDMKLRGHGDIEGTQQSGIPISLKLSDLQRDSDILKTARAMAQEILNEDPALTMGKHSVLNTRLKQIHLNKKTWGVVG
ncbi:MAG: ATP-dependent DNA helicase RecG [Bacteroidota bacterium]|nr:ATP-dependent DNA helicase RecG [Bacteroidota bacterium]